MDSRERTVLCLNHEEPDRVPVDCWASPGTRRKIERRTGASFDDFLDENDVDLRYIPGPRFKGPRRAPPPGADDVDVWGVPRSSVRVKLHDGAGEYEEVYREVLHSPLAGARSGEQLLEYPHWPSADWFDYDEIEAQCDAIHERGRIAVFMGDRLNRLAQLKPAMYLRGPEQILVDLIENPELAETIFRRIVEFYIEYGKRILEAARGKLDILCTGDDFGSQNGPLISPAAWRRFLLPGFRALVGLGRLHGVKVMHHSCGSVVELIEAMSEAGLDILQSLQPEAAGMQPAALKAAFGARLAFHGGVSIQNVLPFGSPGQVREHVSALFRAMAPGGGFIACTSHNIQADTPFANVRALFAAYRDFGRYRTTI